MKSRYRVTAVAVLLLAAVGFAPQAEAVSRPPTAMSNAALSTEAADLPGRVAYVTLLTTGFEPGEGFVVGALEPQLGWTASGGQYVHVPNANQVVTDPTQPGGQVTYTFTVAAGTYVIWGRVIAANTGDNSSWVSMDGGPFALWNMPISSSWVWDQVNNASVADPVLFSLAAGTHTLVVKQREDGARLDRLLVTSDLAFVPQGLGGGNQPPVAADDSAATPSDTAVDILVLQNDSDPDSGPSALFIQSAGTPANGTTQIVGTTIRSALASAGAVLSGPSSQKASSGTTSRPVGRATSPIQSPRAAAVLSR